MGARGSGEAFVGPAGGAAADGVGLRVGTFIDELRLELAGEASIRVEGIDYPADGVELILTGFPFGVTEYLDGATQGVSDMATRLRTHHFTCPNEKVILAGYSQGALVVRDVIDMVASEPEVINQVFAAEVFADPRHIPRSSTNVRDGGGRNGTGIAVSAGVSSATDVPQAVIARTHSWCVKKDIVCDTAANPKKLSDGIAIHTGTWYLETLPKAAAAGLARLVRQIPAVLARELPQAFVGQEYSALISSDLGIEDPTPTWGVVSGSLPPGIELLPAGNNSFLAGVPEAPGTFQFTVEVSINTSLGLTGTRSFAVTVIDPNTRPVGLVAVSSTAGGEVGNDYSQPQPVPSPDGRHVVFQSRATNLLPGVAGEQLFLKDLSSGDLSLVSSTADGVPGNGGSSTPRWINDSWVSFRSDSTNLTPGTSSSATSLFAKNTLTGEIIQVNLNALGEPANGPSSGFVAPDLSRAFFNCFACTNFPGSPSQFYMRDLSSGEVQALPATVDWALSRWRDAATIIGVSGSDLWLIDATSGARLRQFNVLPDGTPYSVITASYAPGNDEIIVTSDDPLVGGSESEWAILATGVGTTGAPALLYVDTRSPSHSASGRYFFRNINVREVVQPDGSTTVAADLVRWDRVTGAQVPVLPNLASEAYVAPLFASADGSVVGVNFLIGQEHTDIDLRQAYVAVIP